MKPLQFSHPEHVPFDRHPAILACYRSGQMSERQWQAHMADPLFALWVKRHA